jgi:hypothetical protein
MGSSLLLRGGSSTPKSIEETISVTHSFIDGDVVRFDPADSTWKLAQANTAENSEVVGVVSNAQAGSFKITYAGYINLSRYAAISSPVLFLDSSVAGGLTGSPPSAIGTVVKPVLTRSTGTSGFIVMNYLGTQIGGSSTVSIEEIQPVGTIMPYAAEGTVPDTWLECDGASYGVTQYPELYTALLSTTGDAAPKYGYVATLTGTNVSAALAVGDYIQYKASAGAFTGTGSPFAGAATNASLLAIVLSVTSTSAVVQVIPAYSSTTKNFTINNTVFGGGGFVGTETGTGNYRAYSTSSAFKGVSLTITSTAITHFNTPDLRGRFPLGVNTSALPSSGDLETDGTNNSAISGIYSLGSEGGQESTIAGTGVTFGNNTGISSYVTSAASGGLIANMPPYTVVRYIIKASPYTRAAIIDGVDIPYDQLLVGDLRSGLLRNAGVGEDLIFKTNTSVATTGTERMRLTNGGNLGIGTTTPTAAFEVIGGVSASGAISGGAISGSRLSVSGGITAGTDIVSTSGNLHLLNTSSAGVATKSGTLHLGVATGLDNGAIANDKIGLTVKTDKRVGVNGIYDPSTSLSVLSQGEGNILSGGVRVWRSASSGAGNVNTPYMTMDVDGNGGAFLAWGDGIRFKTGATGSTTTTADRLYIKGNGNVGIGTTNPGATLDVNGTIKTNTSITVGNAVLAAPAGTAPMFAVRAWGSVNIAGTLLASGNILSSSFASNQYTVTFAKEMSDNSYAVVGSVLHENAGASVNNPRVFKVLSKSTAGFVCTIVNASGYNPLDFSFIVIG